MEKYVASHCSQVFMNAFLTFTNSFILTPILVADDVGYDLLRPWQHPRWYYHNEFLICTVSLLGHLKTYICKGNPLNACWLLKQADLGI